MNPTPGKAIDRLEDALTASGIRHLGYQGVQHTAPPVR